MNRNSKAACWLAAGFVAAAVLVASSAAAYILPGPYILKRAEERLRGCERAYLEGRAVFAKSISLESAAVKLYFSSPDKFRGEFLLGPGTLTAVFSRGTGNISAPGSVDLERLKEWIFLPAPLFVSTAEPGSKSAGDLAGALARRRIDTTQVGIDRFLGRVVYLIGAKPLTFPAGQVWVDKERYSLVRLIVAAEKKHYETVLDGFGKGSFSHLFPARIEVREAREVLLSIEVEEARQNPSLPDALFEWKR